MTDGDALFARALALEDAGRPDEALEQYRRLLADPGRADARHNYGLLLARLGRLEEAEESHREYARTHPESARAWNDLADVLLARGNYHAALDTLDRIAEADATALVRRGVALSCLRRFDAARDAFLAATAADPDEVARFAGRIAPGADTDTLLSPENIFVSRRYMAQGDCDWSAWDEYVAEMRRAAASPQTSLEPAVAFMALHLPLTRDERHGIARHVAARIEARTPPIPPPGPRQGARIRIGILSPDFREHLNAYLLLPLFELLDRRRFELFGYSLAPDDGSIIRARIRSAADAFRDLHARSDASAVTAIRSDGIDVLVDVAGHTTGGRFAIAASRPARVQAAYLGFPGSLGSKRLDFAIVDRVVAPPAEEWAESLAYLPHTFFLYDFRQTAPEMPLLRRDYGLPENAFVYCAFHKAEKISPDTFDLWMEVLRRAPRSVLWFRALSPAASRNLCARAAAREVDPARLVFASFEPRNEPRYLARHRLGDLMLDALHHNAITTACDALAAGLPILTLNGTSMASRAGESLLRAAGLPELVAADRAAFVRCAVQLASDAPRIGEFKARLKRNRWTAPLFDTAGRVRELEAAFEQMLQVSAQRRSRL